jgi:hypothetical protein
MLYDEQQAILDYAHLCNGKREGSRISLLFNSHRLDTECLGSKASLYASLQDRSFCSGLSRALLFIDSTVPTSSAFYHAIRLGVNGISIPHEFRPNTARDIYTRAIPSTGTQLRILDPCAGWGGRMIGAASVGAHYEAYEPSSLTYRGLQSLGVWLQKFKTGFTFRVHHLPFEDSRPTSQSFDVALTSPPYYDTERYSDESTNSLNRYASFGEWCDGFYHPMIRGVLRALRPGADFILNIGDRKYPLSKELLRKQYAVQQSFNHFGLNAGFGRKADDGEKFYTLRA